MDKLAVSEDAQGEGLGRAIFRVMGKTIPRLFWRSRGEPHQRVLLLHSDGTLRDDTWTVFCYGITDWDDVRFAVAHSRERPPSLLP